MSDSSSEDLHDTYLQPRRRSLDDDRGVVDSIDMFAPLPLPVKIKKSAVVEQEKLQQQNHCHAKDVQCCPSLEERLRRYAESQSEIRRQMSYNARLSRRGCPERFRFE